jgi:uncharacterized membrane protein YraQ (UPF0718 family)
VVKNVSGLWVNTLVNLGYWAGIFRHTHTFKIMVYAWQLGSGLWIWFFLGLAITSAIATWVSPATLAKSLQRMQGWGLLLAAVLGLISPLATYSVIPLAVIMLRQGAPLAPITAFMISSPLINPAIFTMTAGGMGMEMALARTITSFALAVVGGWLAGQCEKRWGFAQAYLRQEDTAPLHVPLRHYRKSLDGLRSGRFHRILAGTEKAGVWLRNFGLQIKFAGRFFILALLISAGVRELVSPALVMQTVGEASMYSILLAAAAGIPFYTCGGAAIPMMQVLASMGMSRGAILAFFITGPATNISTIFTLATLFKRNFLILYYAVTLIGAIGAGYLYQWLL